MTGQARHSGWLATIGLSAGQTLVRFWRSRLPGVVAGGAALLLVGCFFVAVRVDGRMQGDTLFLVLAWWLLASVLVPWFVTWIGIQAVHGAIEDRTIHYLFLRPVGRTPVLLGRFLAVAVAGNLVALLGLGVLELAIGRVLDTADHSLPGGHPGYALAAAMMAGCISYAAVAMVFATLFRRPLLWATFFVVGLQQLTANLPVSAGLRQFTITDPMRRFLFDWLDPNPRLAELLWPAEPMFQPEQIGHPLRDLAVFAVVCLGLAMLAFRSIEYDSRPRD